MYNPDFLLCGFLVYMVAIICVLSKKGVNALKNKIYIAFLIVGELACGFDLAGILLCNHFPRGVYQLKSICFFGYHFFHPLTAFFCTLFVMEITGRIHEIDKRKVALLSIPLILFYIPLFLNPAYNTVFYFDSNGIYTRAIFMALEYLAAAFYMGFVLYEIIKYRKAVRNDEAWTISLFIVVTIIGVIIQYFSTTTPTEVFVMSLGSLTVLFTVENRDELYDPVTGLLNRNALMGELQSSISSGIRFHCFGVFFQNYEDVSTRLGYVVTDAIEKSVADFLLSLGKDVEIYDCEDGFFCLLLYHAREARVKEIENALMERFDHPWEMNGYLVPFITTIASYRIPEAVGTLDEIYSMFARRKHHQDEVVKMMREQDLSVFRRDILVSRAISKGLSHGNFQVYYQPIWDSQSDRIHSAEALLRLYDEELGWISPDEFIRVAEETGSIYDLGEFVFESVCRDIGWRDFKSMGIDFVEVNLSPLQCMRSNLVERFRQIMEEYQVSPQQINLEITETATAKSLEMLRNTMLRFQEMGITFSLDDFGTGASNMESLVDLDFEIVKIDKSILWNTKDLSAKGTFLENTIQLLKGSQFKIVVEGVETQEQKAFLESHGCEFCQGYFFHKPASIFDFITYVKKFNKIEAQEHLEEIV